MGTMTALRHAVVALALAGVGLLGVGVAGGPGGGGPPGAAGAMAAGRRLRPAAVRAITAQRPPAAVAGACGRKVASPAYRQVLWVVMENDPYAAVIGSPAAPFATALSRACGVAVDYRAVTHPSLPNYLAMTAGSTFGIADDAEPSAHLLRAPTIFSQLDARRRTWASYAESMAEPCQQVTAGLYAARHNPAVYFVPLRAACRHHDLPMGTLGAGPLATALRRDQLASFTFVTPNVCDDGHSCPLALADAWLARFVGDVVASPAYRSGHVVVFVTWDEGSGADQRVPLLAVAPSVPKGTVARGSFSHYSLLRTTEQLLGLAPLGAAAHAASMAPAFHL